MDIEQLKLILETLTSAGEGAFVFGILWLSKSLIVNVLVFVGALMGMRAIALTVKWITGVLTGHYDIKVAAGFERDEDLGISDISKIIEYIMKGRNASVPP